MRRILIPLALAGVAGAALAQDAPSGPDPMTKIDSATFARQVSSANEFEIRSSRIALEKLADGDLKAFAQQMVDDHIKAGAELQTALAAADKTLPPEELAPRHAAMVKLLEAASGSEIPALYADMQFGAHKEAVALFSAFAKAGDDAQVQEFAAKTLPTLKMHLMRIQAIVEDRPS